MNNIPIGFNEDGEEDVMGIGLNMIEEVIEDIEDIIENIEE